MSQPTREDLVQMNLWMSRYLDAKSYFTEPEVLQDPDVEGMEKTALDIHLISWVDDHLEAIFVTGDQVERDNGELAEIARECVEELKALPGITSGYTFEVIHGRE